MWPFDFDEKHISGLVLILEKDNIERMKQADPVTLETVSKGGFLPVPKYPENFMMMIAYEEDTAIVYEFMLKKDYSGMLKHLRRGYKWTDTDGLKFSWKLPHSWRNN
jgi:hypothetical protein